MSRFKSKEEYERFKAQQKGEAPPGETSPAAGGPSGGVSVKDEILQDATAAIAWGTTRTIQNNPGTEVCWLDSQLISPSP